MSDDRADLLLKVLNDRAKPDPSLIGSLPKGGSSLDYMGHAAVTRVLIEEDPLWSWEPVCDDKGIPIIEAHGKRLVMWGHLTVHGKTLMCCGTCEDRKFEPEKELIGDLLRNGAMRFGIGLALWSKDEWSDLGVELPSVQATELLDRIRELPQESKDQLKEYAHRKGYRVTANELTDVAIADLGAWITRAEPFEETADG